MAGTDVYTIVADRILDMLDKGTVPWRKPWKASTDLPRNLVSKRPYKGVNVWLLLSRGFASPYWLTFKQAESLGGKVRKGEKGTPVVFWRQIEKPDPDAPNGKKKIPLLRYFTVFNVEQVDGIEVPVTADPGQVNDPLAEAEAIVQGMPNPPDIGWDGGGRAFYRPSADRISMPPRNSFESPEAVYATLFHELGHSTGHESRLSRSGVTDSTHFGDENYGREELVAEFTAAFLCGEAGIAPAVVDNSAAYVQSWINTIKADKRAAVTAASAAQRAADYILNRQQPEAPAPEVSNG